MTKNLLPIFFISIVAVGISSAAYAQTISVSTPVNLSVQPNNAAEGSSDISGDLVVWGAFSGGSGQLFLHNLSTGQTTAFQSGFNPRISGNLVVFTQGSFLAATRDLRFCVIDRANNTCNMSPIIIETGTIPNYDLNGNRIVWTRFTGIPTVGQVRFTEIVNGVPTPIQTVPSLAEPVGTLALLEDGPVYYVNANQDIEGFDITSPNAQPFVLLNGGPVPVGPVFANLTGSGNKLVFYTRIANTVTDITTCLYPTPTGCSALLQNPIPAGLDYAFVPATSFGDHIIAPLLNVTASEVDLHLLDLTTSSFTQLTPVDGSSIFGPAVWGDDLIFSDVSPVSNTTDIFNVEFSNLGVRLYGHGSNNGSDNCPGPVALDANRDATVGNSSSQYSITDAPPNAVGSILATLAPMDPPFQIFPGLFSFVDLTVTNPVFVASDAFGSAGFSFPIPSSVAPGTQIFLQAVFANPPNCGGSGFSASNALEITAQ